MTPIRKRKRDLVKWIPIYLSVLFIAFVSLFAIDAKSISDLFMNLFPSYVVMVTTIISWFLPVIGGHLFIGLGAAYAVAGWGQFNIKLALLLIIGPLFLIGILFIFQAIRK
ncbi:MAG: hypothetical protein QF755_06810 [Candidatus Peribacteraceae bacterium]|jgi:hypothetical protein|nr:hypothetical protein [Candidatus Peribacteraceae bacterium]HCI04281.1 hypothetical protein [Candidatus Peribacteria bacterium]|tara:strand:- start:3277 stop:3609 length:333 start_codon:yes stop_codon:yes gene_type:complete